MTVKKLNKKRSFICVYANENGKKITKTFDSLDKGLNFVAVLDKRIVNGTCFGYTFTEL